MTEIDRLFIGGEWIAPAGSDRSAVINPSTEEIIGWVPVSSEADVDAAVAAARAAFDDPQGWSTWDPAQRADVMVRFADALASRAERIAATVSSQNGMPIAISRTREAAYPAKVLRYYADLARNTDWEDRRPGYLGQGDALVTRRPVGVVAAIVPWNFPQALTAFKLGPALAAGCTIVLKPSLETALDAVLLADAAREAGVPAGVLSVIPGGRDAGRYLVSHPDVDKVAFTGSTGAGREIGQVCGHLLKPVTLELGGKSAAIFLDDADLNLDVIGVSLFNACLANNGQTCHASTRILAPASRYDEVVEVLVSLVSSLVVGDALDESTRIGPLVSSAQRDRVEAYIAQGIAAGGRIATGGGRPEALDRGWFVQPTVFTGLDNSATLAREEIFGPVLTVIEYQDEDEAVRIANDSEYGLGGTVWTTDHDRGEAIARQVRTGAIGINRFLVDPAAPFGGVKASGLGRELGPEALEGYLEYRSIYA